MYRTEQTMTDAYAIADEFFLDAFSPEARVDPYPLYARYRERHVEGGANGGVTRIVLGHAECATVLRDPRYSSDEHSGSAFQEFAAADPSLVMSAGPRSLVFMDPPDHTRIRSLVMSAFTPSMVERIRPRAEEITVALIDDLVERGAGGAPVDIIEHLALPLPVTIICELLGVPAADHAVFGGWANTLARSIDPAILRSADVNAAIEAADAATAVYLADLLTDRRRSPGDDLFSKLVEVESAGDRLTSEELVALAMLLLIAGFETTVNLISNGMYALLTNRTELVRVADKPELMRAGVDELLRFDSPVQWAQRIAMETMPFGDGTIQKGDQVLVVIGAANRDPSVFDDPDRLDLTRDARRHLAFGGGIHHCLGSALAKTEGMVAIGELVRRFPGIDLAGEPIRRDSFTLRGLSSLPVTLGG
jgi:pimeloyl-[acyl-carrier protein] synthase